MNETVSAIRSAQERFFSEVARRLPPKPIAFYPGSGPDNTLEVFMPDAISVHLDKDFMKKLPGNGVYGIYEKLPFKNKVFDVAYINDSHATKEDFDTIIQTLKPEGLVIFNTLFSCGPYQIDDAFENPRLKLVFSSNTGVTESYVFKKFSYD